MPDKINPPELEYIDKAFGLNIDQTFEDVDPEYMPARLKRFIEQGRNKRIYIGGTEKKGAKAFKTMIEKRSAEKKIVPTPLIAIHREVGSTTDKYDYYGKTTQFYSIAQAFKAQILPKTFSYTIQIIGKRDQRDLLEIMTGLIDGRLHESNMLLVPHIVKWDDNGPQQEELPVYVQLSKMDIDNPAWTPEFEGEYLTLEKGQEALTHIILSSVITPDIIDFNFLGVESL
ncbi:hypothetical protein KAR91_55955 [Candidatus Pacearchaeota archaeon]|nr:hypothetical protein [Candidatus Pacearchaeota archaeon]